MPTARNGDVELYYETAGSSAAGPTVAFTPEAGLGAWLWGWQAPALAGPREVVVWDPRGTGRSDAQAGSRGSSLSARSSGDSLRSSPGPYDVATLAADLEAVLADAGARRAHLAGCGLGGMVSLAHARRYGRARSVTLLNAAASGDAVDRDALERLFGDGWPAVAFSEAYRAAAADGERGATPLAEFERWRDEDDADPAAREAQVAAALSFDAGALYEHDVPALVLSAVDDPVVPSSAGESLAEGLPRGEFRATEGRHLSFVEHATAVTDEVARFVDEIAESGR